jgi:hypothetical protein
VRSSPKLSIQCEGLRNSPARMRDFQDLNHCVLSYVEYGRTFAIPTVNGGSYGGQC